MKYTIKWFVCFKFCFKNYLDLFQMLFNLIFCDYFKIANSNKYLHISSGKMMLSRYHKTRFIREMAGPDDAYKTRIKFRENGAEKILGVVGKTVAVKSYPGNKNDSFSVILNGSGNLELRHNHSCVILNTNNHFRMGHCRNAAEFIFITRERPDLIKSSVKLSDMSVNDKLLSQMLRGGKYRRSYKVFWPYQKRVNKIKRYGSRLVQQYFVSII